MLVGERGWRARRRASRWPAAPGTERLTNTCGTQWRASASSSRFSGRADAIEQPVDAAAVDELGERLVGLLVLEVLRAQQHVAALARAPVRAADDLHVGRVGEVGHEQRERARGRAARARGRPGAGGSPSSCASARTRSRVSSRTDSVGSSLSTRETVDFETPAARATSSSRARVAMRGAYLRGGESRRAYSE